MIRLFLVAAFVLAADRVTKKFADARVGARKPPSKASWFHLRRVFVRFRHCGQIHNLFLVLLWVTALTGIILASASGRFFQNVASQMGLSAALAGSGSNLYDRLTQGATIDFIGVGGWPIFNVADVAITLGSLIAFWFM